MPDYQEAKKQEVKKSGSTPPVSKTKEKSSENNGVPCPNCGASIPEGALFCPECGADLSAPAFCPNCGEKTFPGGDICQGCGTWLLEGQCKFCYAELDPNAAFCSECGNPKDGVQCPHCGSLSIFDFCTKCGKPLTEGAAQAIELAKSDPDAKEMVEAIQQAVTIEAELAELEALINSEPSIEDIPIVDTAPQDVDFIPPVDIAPPPPRRERFSAQQMAAITNTDKNMEAAAQRREEDEKRAQEAARKLKEDQERQAKIREKKAREEARAKDEMERQAKIRDAIARREALERQREKAIADAMIASAKCRTKSFPSHQDARRFHNAMKPDRTSGWQCNYSGTIHDDGPNGCAEPSLGGYWV